MRKIATFFRWLATSGVVLANGLLFAAPAQAAGTDDNAFYQQQIVQLVNQDRAAADLSALTVDPRLTIVAEQRAQYLIANGYFSHCTNGASEPACADSGLDFVPRLQEQGVGVTQPGTTLEENLALNNFLAISPSTAGQQTNSAWMQSATHQAHMLNPAVTVTGVAVVCCWVGDVQGRTITAQDQASVIVQLFAGGPGAAPGT